MISCKGESEVINRLKRCQRKGREEKGEGVGGEVSGGVKEGVEESERSWERVREDSRERLAAFERMLEINLGLCFVFWKRGCSKMEFHFI